MHLRFHRLLNLLNLFPLLLLSACSGAIKDVQTFAYQGGVVRGGMLNYDHSPPAGGPYSPLWQSCGLYGAPIYPEYAVHSLARGAVWLSYRPSLSPEDLAALKDVVKDQPNVLLSPVDNQPALIMATAWNAQLSVDSVTDRRLRRFVQNYVDAGSVPEVGASCAGGYTGTQS